jgi:hypothetical protein
MGAGRRAEALRGIIAPEPGPAELDDPDGDDF